MLKANGAEEVCIDDGSCVEEVRDRHPDGFSKVLELVGVTLLADSCSMPRRTGFCVGWVLLEER